ncbi:MAG: LAGLIDADG family homing endonuclease, partial [Candidatus Micrarchaeia archaeon]
TGIAAKAIHPAAMVILDEFPAIGTQLKLERPGKGCIATPCNEIDGPIVLLESGDVKQLQTLQEAKHLSGKVKEVLFLGDLLVNYGDFYKSNHPLVQAAWCQEWFKLLLEKEGVRKTINEINEMSFEEALALSQEKKVPLSPKFTFFYHDLSSTQLFELCQWLCTGSLLFEGERFNGLKVKTAEQKRLLECLGVPHVLQEGFVNVDCENALALLSTLGLLDGKILSSARIESFFDGQVDSMTLVNNASGFKVMKKAGLYVGASMGRPEKAKERKMQPPVHALFPIGQHGGKIRSVVKAIKNLREGGGFSSGLAELEVANRVCPKCRQKLLNAKCPSCNLRAVELSSCSKCGTPLRQDQKKCKCGSFGSLAEKRQVNVYEEFNRACKNVAFVPKEIKGVIGLISASKTPELLEKGLLRAKHSVFVFRDGTCRFDATEVPLTHFVPAEVGTSVEKLKELGYVKDVEGKPLKSASQVVELKPQDLVLSNNGADYLLKVARFVDDELSYVYRKKPFYNAKSLDDMVGHQVIVIAPHTSAGILGRIIGFTTARGILAHPYLHCATRRNCLSSSQMVYYENDSAVHVESAAQMFQKYFELFGSVEQHAVQKVELLKKRKVFAFGAVTNGKQSKKRVKSISRRWFEGRVLEIKAENGQEVEVTPNHVVWVWNGTELKEKVAGELCEDDLLASLSNVSTSENVLRELNLVDVFETDDESDSFSVRTSKDFCKKVVSSFGGMQRLQEKLGLSKIQVKNYFFRAPHSLPLSVYLKVRTRSSDAVFSLGFKHNFASLPITLKLSDAFFKLLGYYVSEGWIWKSNVTGKESFHVGFAASVKEIRGELSQLLKEVFKLQATVSDKDVVVTNKLLYKFFKEFLCVGKGAYEKQIPELVFSASESQKYAFLSGCFQGDANISRLEVKYCTVSEKLASQLNFLLSSLDIASTFKKEKKNVKSGIVFEKYAKKGKEVPQCILHYVCVYSYDMEKLCKNLSLSGAKKNAIQNSCKKRGRRLLKKTKDLVVSKVKKITERNYSDFVYDLELEKGSDKVFAAGKGKLLMHNCDGDEDCVLLLMDGLLNFSKKFLPETRGGKMDAPLVLTTLLDPLEVDDEVHAMDACSKYPLEFYEASLNNTSPGDVKLDTISSRLGKPSQYEGIGFTHKASLEGPVQTKYVQLGDMAEKVAEELVLMQKVRAVDAQDAAERVLLSHFLPDIYGNLRKFSKQSFRCVGCNAKYRRVPLAGVCRKCGGKLLLTVNKGGIEKYLKLSQNIVEKYGLPNYLKQRLMLIEREINSIFEDEKVKQFSLADYV